MMHVICDRFPLVKRLLVIGLLCSGCAWVARSETSNLLRNASFEEPVTPERVNEALHWTILSPDMHGDYFGSASREDWRALTGNFIGTVRGLWAGHEHFGGVWQEAPATPGASYRFGGWFLCDIEWSARIQEIKIEFWDKTVQVLLSEQSTSVADCDMDWEERWVEATAPDQAAWVRVVVHVSDAGAMGALQFDDLYLYLVAAP